MFWGGGGKPCTEGFVGRSMPAQIKMFIGAKADILNGRGTFSFVCGCNIASFTVVLRCSSKKFLHDNSILTPFCIPHTLFVNVFPRLILLEHSQGIIELCLGCQQCTAEMNEVSSTKEIDYGVPRISNFNEVL